MLVSAENLTFRYPDAAKPALRGISLTVHAGDYVAILGANGSGKSTFARCVAGLLAPDSGSVRFDVPEGCVPSALVFQSPADQLVAETVELDAAFGPENLGMSRERMRTVVRSSLEAFNLDRLADTPVHSLSSGRKQHLALAGVRALDPALFVLDEPTSMLSPLARKSLLDVLDRFRLEGGTVMHITHDMDEAARADRVVVLEDGLLVFDGSPTELAAVQPEALVRWGLAYDAGAGATHTTGTPHTTGAPHPADSPHTTGAPLLSVRSVCRGPVRNVSFDLAPGTITMITGESGSGKTLLLEMLAGLVRPDSGNVELVGDSAAALAVQESEASLFAEFVADDIAWGPRNSGLSGKPLVERVRRSMDLCGLPFADFAERRTFSLSGGERRKAALAGIIAMDTPVVLLDEPSSALDVKSRGALIDLLCALRSEGKAVVCSTNREEECAIADRVIALESGEFSDCGTPDNASAKSSRARSGDPVSSAHTARDPGPHTPSTREQASLERLRLGAAGSYRKLDTSVHRLSPLSKYILAASQVAAALAVQSWPFILLLLALEAIPAALSRLPVRNLVRSFFRVLPWLVFFGALQLYFNPADPFAPVLFILRFAALLVPLSVFVFSAGHTEIMYGMEDMFGFLRIIRIPVRDLALVTGIVFRFVGLLYEEAARITAARIVRSSGSAANRAADITSNAGATRRFAGATSKVRVTSKVRATDRHNRLSVRIRSMASLFVPLILRTLTRAERLSQAITARYYGTRIHSRYLEWKAGRIELFLRVALPLAAAVLVYASIATRMYIP